MNVTAANRVAGEGFEMLLRELYPHSTPREQRERWLGILQEFAASFGSGGSPSLFSAPGRVELAGNHTDHQNGRVLAAAITCDAAGAAIANDSPIIRINSQGFTPDIIDISDLSPDKYEHGKPAALVRGIVAHFLSRGFAASGFDAYISSDVPVGSGLSSSAAFETLIGTMLNGLFNDGKAGSADIAAAGRHAENVYFGKPSGLMDQTVSATGGILMIDFKDSETPVALRVEADLKDYAICVTQAGGDHSALTEDYAAIPAEMSSVAGFFGMTLLRSVKPELFYGKLRELRNNVGDRAVLRSMHFFAENERVQAGAGCLGQGDTAGFMRLINESGRSSWELLQNIYRPGAVREQPLATALALSDRLLAGRGASRVHGGGFAGTILAFVPVDMLEDYTKGLEFLTGAGSCRVVNIRLRGASQILTV